MRVSRIIGACLAASLAIAIGGAGVANAEVPEFGRCVKVTLGTGKYTSATCLTKSTAPSNARYEWTPVSGTEKLTFAGTGAEPTIITAGHPTISCPSANLSGEYTGPKTASVTIELQGCLDQNTKQCQTPAATKSQIKTFPMEAELGYTRHEIVNGKLIVAVGLDLKATPPLTALASYECTGSEEIASIQDSVIGKLKPWNKMTTESNLNLFVRKTGQQIPESFAGGPKDTLNTSFMKGLETTGPFPTTLKIASETGTNSVPLEIKAVEK
jgi:hypothetical protein